MSANDESYPRRLLGMQSDIQLTDGTTTIPLPDDVPVNTPLKIELVNGQNGGVFGPSGEFTVPNSQ